MSAFIVSNLHLNAVVDAIMTGYSGKLLNVYEFYYNGIRVRRTANEIGQTLLDVNYAGVNVRYNSNEPTPKFERLNKRSHYSALQYIKLIDSFEYQSCDNDGWNGSEAQCILHIVRCRLITEIPGYDQAKWTI